MAHSIDYRQFKDVIKKKISTLNVLFMSMKGSILLFAVEGSGLRGIRYDGWKMFFLRWVQPYPEELYQLKFR